MAPPESNNSTTTNKRKRGGGDQGPARPSPASRTAAAALEEQTAPPQTNYDEGALSQIIAHNNGDDTHAIHNGPNTTVAETAAAALTQYQVPASFEPGAQSNSEQSIPFTLESGGFTLDQLKDPSQQAPQTPQQGTPQTPATGAKPPVGSDEWHRIRRDNHKEGKHFGSSHIAHVSNLL